VDKKPAGLKLQESRSHGRATSKPPASLVHDPYQHRNPARSESYSPEPTAAPSAPPPVAVPTSASFPGVTRWFKSLDEHEDRNQDGILYAPFGSILHERGFFRITQLDLEFVTTKDLEEWLEVKLGVAVLIMQYVKEDIAAIKAGTLTFARARN
jgi:hypothetical protein